MVAPSFQDYEVLSDPFLKGNKLYIKVKHPHTHNEREVRWYSPEEYSRQYSGKVDEGYFTGLKEARGFSEGPILVVCNPWHELKQLDSYLHRSPARFATDVGWYFLINDSIPTPPIPLKIVGLTWDEFRYKDDFHKKTAAELLRIIKDKQETIYYGGNV